MMKIQILKLFICIIIFPLYQYIKSCQIHLQHNYIKFNDDTTVDLTWSQYIDLVYGDNTAQEQHPTLQKISNKFEFFYLNTHIKFLSLTPFITPSVVRALPTARFINNPYHDHHSYESYQWVEVMRYKVHNLFNQFPAEGLFALNWTNIKGYHYQSPTKVPYGCWFYSAPGSGIYVNVGKVLVIDGKYKDLKRHFPDILTTPSSCALDDNHHIAASNCFDGKYYYCAAALAKGMLMMMMIYHALHDQP